MDLCSIVTGGHHDVKTSWNDFGVSRGFPADIPVEHLGHPMRRFDADLAASSHRKARMMQVFASVNTGEIQQQIHLPNCPDNCDIEQAIIELRLRSQTQPASGQRNVVNHDRAAYNLRDLAIEPYLERKRAQLRERSQDADQISRRARQPSNPVRQLHYAGRQSHSHRGDEYPITLSADINPPRYSVESDIEALLEIALRQPQAPSDVVTSSGGHHGQFGRTAGDCTGNLGNRSIPTDGDETLPALAHHAGGKLRRVARTLREP